MKFKAERIDYFKRLRREFLFGFFILTGIIIYVHLKNGDIYNSTNILVTAGMISVVGSGLGVSAHLTAKRYFHEVELTDQDIILRGDSMNKLISVEFPLRDTT